MAVTSSRIGIKNARELNPRVDAIIKREISIWGDFVLSRENAW